MWYIYSFLFIIILHTKITQSVSISLLFEPFWWTNQLTVTGCINEENLVHLVSKMSLHKDNPSSDPHMLQVTALEPVSIGKDMLVGIPPLIRTVFGDLNNGGIQAAHLNRKIDIKGTVNLFSCDSWKIYLTLTFTKTFSLPAKFIIILFQFINFSHSLFIVCSRFESPFYRQPPLYGHPPFYLFSEPSTFGKTYSINHPGPGISKKSNQLWGMAKFCWHSDFFRSANAFLRGLTGQQIKNFFQRSWLSSI